MDITHMVIPMIPEIYQVYTPHFQSMGIPDGPRGPGGAWLTSAKQGVLRVEFLSNLRQSAYCYLAYLVKYMVA